MSLVWLTAVVPGSIRHRAGRLQIGRRAHRKHVLAMMVEARVMLAAEPAYMQRVLVVVVMGIDIPDAADFAGLLFQMT